MILKIESAEGETAAAKPGAFLVAKKGDGEVVGKSRIAAGGAGAAGLGEEILSLEMSDQIDPRFFDLTNNSGAGRAYYAAHSVDDGASKKIETTAVTHMPFPIPPRAEQERLVEKVGRWMGYCDELEKRLEKRDAVRRELLGEAVGKLLQAAG